MKKIFFTITLVLLASISMQAQVLEEVTEEGNTGIRLIGANPANYGDIGSYSFDITVQGAASATRGATGTSAVAMGHQTTASGAYSTAMGSTTIASGNYSLSAGLQTTASGAYSFAVGSSTTASANYSLALGRSTTASGVASTAMGPYTIAADYGSFVIGQYNSSLSSVTTDGHASLYDTDNTAFVIGNGTGLGSESDAFKVMFNGDATVSNDLTVSGDVNVSSDARLKSNIVSLGSTLSKLLLIDGKSYTIINDGDKKIGVLAQDIQKAFPELVGTDDKDMLTVNYQGLVPVLINAIKEQENKITRLENLVEQLIDNNQE